MSRGSTIVALILSVLTISACSGPSRIQTGFDAVRPGQTTAAEVVNLMGNPEHKSVHNLGGLEMQVWQFEDSKATYTLMFGAATFAGVDPRVISKDMEPKSGT